MSLLVDVRRKLDQNRELDGRFFDVNQKLVLALIAAAAGNADEAQRLGRTWLRESTADLAERANRLPFACRTLGMAGATADAVGCIRAGLAEPSLVMPFIEPYLPFYDSMRDEPEFVALLAEIEESTGSEEGVEPE